MNKGLRKKKKIALVAHDRRKPDLIDWCRKNAVALKGHSLFATGTTGKLVADELKQDVHQYFSGPLGGDFQIGAAIVQGEIDMLIFFWDPLESLGHDPDVKALLRLATMWNIPMACNESSADFFLQSTHFNSEYDRSLKVVEAYNKGKVS